MKPRRFGKSSQQYELLKKKRDIGIDPANLILGLWGSLTLYVIIHTVLQIKMPLID